jgi:hypothetical protein
LTFDNLRVAVAEGDQVDLEQRHPVGVALDLLGLEVAHRFGVLDQHAHQHGGVDRQPHRDHPTRRLPARRDSTVDNLTLRRQMLADRGIRAASVTLISRRRTRARRRHAGWDDTRKLRFVR